MNDTEIMLVISSFLQWFWIIILIIKVDDEYRINKLERDLASTKDIVQRLEKKIKKLEDRTLVTELNSVL